MKKYRITVIGAGYVGLSVAVLLARKFSVTVVDIDPEKVSLINRRIPVFNDVYMCRFFAEEELDLTATKDIGCGINSADYIILALPTNYDPEIGSFDCTKITGLIRIINENGRRQPVIIKSTVPFGYTKSLREMYPDQPIIFVPEFLRETKALYDSLYPTRIVIGCDDSCREEAEIFADMLVECAQKNDIPLLFVSESEAEAIKLFSNAYLATRVCFFNELDTFAESKGLDTKHIIDGLSFDSRIGNYYNNPSFGYGGYCLPKDTKQLSSNFEDVQGVLFESIIKSNEKRKEYISEIIVKKAMQKAEDPVIGFFGLSMKSGSDNYRESAVLDVIKKVQGSGFETIIYEPMLTGREFMGCCVIEDLGEFKRKSDLIVSNRYSENDLADVVEKLYTRDIFERD